MTKEQIREKAFEFVSERASGMPKEMEYYAEILTQFVVEKIIGNGIEWHDLRKDPNDLPESSPFHEVLNENGMKMYYDDVLKKWNMFTQHGIVQARPPIAWCEIPQFTE